MKGNKLHHRDYKFLESSLDLLVTWHRLHIPSLKSTLFRYIGLHSASWSAKLSSLLVSGFPFKGFSYICQACSIDVRCELCDDLANTLIFFTQRESYSLLAHRVLGVVLQLNARSFTWLREFVNFCHLPEHSLTPIGFNVIARDSLWSGWCPCWSYRFHVHVVETLSNARANTLECGIRQYNSKVLLAGFIVFNCSLCLCTFLFHN